MLILYSTGGGKRQIEIRAEVAKVWLTYLEMTELLDATEQNMCQERKSCVEVGILRHMGFEAVEVSFEKFFGVLGSVTPYWAKRKAYEN